MNDGRDIDTYYGDESRDTSGMTTEQWDEQDNEQDMFTDEDYLISNDTSYLSYTCLS